MAKILIIDDDTDFVTGMRILFQSCGHQFFAAFNAEMLTYAAKLVMSRRSLAARVLIKLANVSCTTSRTTLSSGRSQYLAVVAASFSYASNRS